MNAELLGLVLGISCACALRICFNNCDVTCLILEAICHVKLNFTSWSRRIVMSGTQDIPWRTQVDVEIHGGETVDGECDGRREQSASPLKHVQEVRPPDALRCGYKPVARARGLLVNTLPLCSSPL